MLMRVFTYDSGTVHRVKCDRCNECLDIRRCINKNNDAYAAVAVEAHRHEGKVELFVSCIFGTWYEERDDKVTFACRYGDVPDRDEPACSLVNARPTISIETKLLTRQEALDHPLQKEFWEVVDFILETDSSIHNYMYHPLKSRLLAYIRK